MEWLFHFILSWKTAQVQTCFSCLSLYNFCSSYRFHNIMLMISALLLQNNLKLWGYMDFLASKLVVFLIYLFL